MRKIFYVLAMLVFMSGLSMSCTGGNAPAETPNAPKEMAPTEEYNYLLSPESLDSNLASLGEITESEDIPKFADMIQEIGYGNPEIKGMSDGTIIKVQAHYPSLPDNLEYSKILAKMPKPKKSFEGGIKPEAIIGYLMLPGIQPIVDTSTEYIDLMNENKPESEEDGGPLGFAGQNYNPVKQALGFAMMFGVNPQEDIFKWMDTEMGVLFYVVKDNEGLDYMNTAYAISVNNKDMAVEKMRMLIGKVPGLDGSSTMSEIFESTEYNGFPVDIAHLDKIMDGGIGFGLDDSTPKIDKMSILYTDNWIYISDDYGINQLSGLVSKESGGSNPEGHVYFKTNLDEMTKKSKRYQDDLISSMTSEFPDDPEMQKLIDEYTKKIQSRIDAGGFGENVFSLECKDDGIDVTLNTSKNTVELIKIMDELRADIVKIAVEDSEEGESEGIEDEESEGEESEEGEVDI